jgi:tetratricopeptide (TPR) repeat protein
MLMSITKSGFVTKCGSVVLLSMMLGAMPVCAQSSPQPVRVAPALVQQVEPPPSNASAVVLEARADLLRAEKNYFEALDYYQAASEKESQSAVLYNKMGITELLLQRLRDAQKDFERSLRLDRHYADAYNNLGVIEYLRRKNGKAIAEYKKAITAEPDMASYFSNLGTAYFAKKEWKECSEAYAHALSLDPNVFESISNLGVSGQVSSPKDRAHFSYFLAKLYAKQGLTDRSLEYLRRAMEEGYKGIDEVYKDEEFTQLRKDPRFVQLMSAPPVAIPE